MIRSVAIALLITVGGESDRMAIGCRVIVQAGRRKIVRDPFPVNVGITLTEGRKQTKTAKLR
jgi:hypothetical protein